MDIAAVATLVGSIGTAATAVLKALQAVRKAEAAGEHAVAIELQREQTKQERDREHKDLETRVALLEQMREVNEKRLEAGTKEFERINAKLDQQTHYMGRTNELLNQLIGAAQAGGLKIKPIVPMDGKMDV